MEAVGIEPTSEELTTKGATCLVCVFVFSRLLKHRQSYKRKQSQNFIPLPRHSKGQSHYLFVPLIRPWASLN